MEPPDTSEQSSSATPMADPIVRLDLIGTALFVVSAVLAAALFTSTIKVIGVIVALVLFACGVFAFLWSYFAAVQRSRTDEIGVAQLYFLTGPPTPSGLKRTMNGLLLVQVVVALATAIGRNSTDGRTGSTLAFGILVPMFGLGLNGLWCARNGKFPARRQSGAGTNDAEATVDVDEPTPDQTASVPESHDEMEQNSRHG